jgi:hypothetical protein
VSWSSYIYAYDGAGICISCRLRAGAFVWKQLTLW